MSKAQFEKESDRDGRFIRQASRFRNQITTDGEFRPRADRYHLYVSLACPWAHRTVIVRQLKGLQSAVSLSVLDPLRDQKGWAFRDVAGAQLDPLNGFNYLSEAYLASDSEFTGRVTVPVLWDKQSKQIVNNESADIIRMLNGSFNEYASNPSLDLYPTELREEIDRLNGWIYPTINNGVYRAGFAATQVAYEEAVVELFDSLDRLERLLSQRRYLAGACITEADWRLFTTLIRFDSVYVSHFKCSLRRLVDYSNIWAYLRELYQIDGVADTVNFDHIKRHYYITHERINPTGVVPLGPQLDLLAEHGRDLIQ